MEFLCCYSSSMIIFSGTRAKGHFYYVDLLTKNKAGNRKIIRIEMRIVFLGS